MQIAPPPGACRSASRIGPKDNPILPQGALATAT